MKSRPLLLLLRSFVLSFLPCSFLVDPVDVLPWFGLDDSVSPFPQTDLGRHRPLTAPLRCVALHCIALRCIALHGFAWRGDGGCALGLFELDDQRPLLCGAATATAFALQSPRRTDVYVCVSLSFFLSLSLSVFVGKRLRHRSDVPLLDLCSCIVDARSRSTFAPLLFFLFRRALKPLGR